MNEQRISISQTAFDKLQKLQIQSEQVQNQLIAFLHGYLAASGIDGGIVERIDYQTKEIVLAPLPDDQNE